MFIYFNKNKLAYHKGQLAPFFIVFIILLLIAALVTVNIGKIGLIKTHSSNAADAGALAGGSVMATVFNAQAIMNSEMIVAYETFYASMAVLIGVIITSMWWAVAACGVNDCGDITCCSSSGCASAIGIAIKGTYAAIIALIAFQVRQFFYYKTMKRQAMDGRDDAIEAAYRYAFLNSGIGRALISGEPPSDPEEYEGDINNYSDTFNDWIQGSAVTSGDYIWKDGQERNHQVHVDVDTEEVGTYKLKLPALPTAVLLAFLYDCLTTGLAIESAGCPDCPCTEPAMIGMVAVSTIFALAVLAGLFPAWNFDASGFAMVMFPICWVTNINHNRLLAVTTWQEHEGQDYGVMGQTTYPHIESYSQTDFRGNGKIYSPDPHFDVTIIKTDELAGE